MTLKDLVRLMWRRRLMFGAVFAVVFLGLFFATQTEPVFFTSRIKVMIETPEPIQVAERAPARLLPHPISVATWVELMTDKGVRSKVKEKLQGTPREALIAGGWVDRVRTETREGTLLTTIIAEGPDPEAAKELATLYAGEAAAYSRTEAESDLNASRKSAGELIQQKESLIADLRLRLDQIRREAGVGNLPLEAERVGAELGESRARINEIARSIDGNNKAITRHRAERHKVSTLSSETVPISDPSVEALAESNPRVQSLKAEISRLRHDLLTNRRRYTPDHPDMVRKRDDLILREVELTQVIVDAVRSGLDREEVLTRAENVRLADERDQLALHAESLRREVERLEDPLRRHIHVDAEIAREERARDELVTIQARLQSVKVVKGYVKQLPDQVAGDAVPTQPRSRQMLVLAVLIALVAGAGTVYLLEQMDTRLRTDYDVKRHLNIPVLSVVPKVRAEDRLLLDAARATMLAENFDTLVTMLPTLAPDRQIRTLAIVSPNPEEGKTTISINTAAAAARQGKRVLLVDGDMRKPGIHQMMKLTNEIGFSNLLAGTISDAESERLYHDCGIENLRVITSGPHPENPYQLLEARQVRPVLEQLLPHFDLIIFDTPPILMAGDGIKLAAIADASLVVIGAYETDHRQAVWAKHLLQNVNAKVLGVVLNKAPRGAAEEYYYYYSSYYGYSKASRA